MEDYNISAVLKQLRKTSGYSAIDVIEKLKEYNIHLSPKTLYGYESGISMLNADVFVALCRIYNCDNPLDILINKPNDYTDTIFLKRYHSLDSHGKEIVDFVLEKELERLKKL